MKIICTKQEKDLLIKALDESGVCIFPDEDCSEFSSLNKNICIACFEKRIEWKITDQPQNLSQTLNQ